MGRRGGALLAGLLLVIPGCLSSTYRVPRSELLRLAEAPPELRGTNVRVVQRFVSQDEPPPAQPVSVHPVVGIYAHGVIPVTPPRRPRSSGGGSAGGGGGGSGGSGGGGNVGGDRTAAALILLAGAGVAIGLAASEGARYDGWVSIHPMHPVHLIGADGEHAVVPLAELTPHDAAFAEEAILVREEGPWKRLGRAPLNRVGFTYTIDLGTAGMEVLANDAPWGFYGRLAFGGFPLQEIGLLATLGFGWGDGQFDDSVFNMRYGLELQAIPLALGPVHLGVYAEGGIVHRTEDVPRGTVTSDAFVFGGGGLLQLELTTRLAITVRGGATLLPRREGGTVTAPQATVGLAIF